MGPLPYSWQNVVLVAVQSLLVALPAAGLPPFARHFAGRAWSLVLPASIAIVVAALAVVPALASGLTWLALVAVPLLAAAAVGWAMHGARPWLAALAVPVAVVAVAEQGERWGQGAALALTALSCVTLGRLLAGVVGGVAGRQGAAVPAAAAVPAPAAAAVGLPGSAPAAASAPAPPAVSESTFPPTPGAASGVRRAGWPRRRGSLRRLAGAVPPLAWIRIALVAMAAIDAVLVFSGGLERPNDALNAAVPSVASAELPRLQFLQFAGASMGYGDVFVAAVLGAVLAAEGASRRRQLAAAVVVLALSLVFDLLFAVVDVLPATVPVAVAALLFGGWRGTRR